MASIQHVSKRLDPAHGDDWLLRRTQQRLDAMARERGAYARHLAASEKALMRAWMVLARSYGHPSCAVAPRFARQPLRDGGAEPAADLGGEIAVATLDTVRHLADTGGIAFEVSDPEPILRGIASAYAAIAHTLPGGLDEAWAILGLLALELGDAGRQTRGEAAASV